jgi:hypothetical protein
MSAEDSAESIDEIRAEGRPRNAVIKQFLSEALSPDTFGLTAWGAETVHGAEWLWFQYVQRHPDDREEHVRLVVRPVIRDGALYLEAARFDKLNDPSGARSIAWEDEVRRRNHEEIERLRGADGAGPW